MPKKAIYDQTKYNGVSLVMPVYNEADVIGQVIKKYSETLQKIPRSEFVICEDGSTDGTKEKLRLMKNKYRLTLYQSLKRKGAVGGFLNALRHAGKDIVFFSDSDNTHDPNDVFSLLKMINDYDMVIGWKFPRQDPWFRIIMSDVFNVIINTLYGTKLHDINSGFRIIKKELLDALLPSLGSFPANILSELTLLAIQRGYTVTEIPVHHYLRTGQSRAFDPKKLPVLVFGILNALLRLRFRKQ